MDLNGREWHWLLVHVLKHRSTVGIRVEWRNSLEGVVFEGV